MRVGWATTAAHAFVAFKLSAALRLGDEEVDGVAARQDGNDIVEVTGRKDSILEEEVQLNEAARAEADAEEGAEAVACSEAEVEEEEESESEAEVESGSEAESEESKRKRAHHKKGKGSKSKKGKGKKKEDDEDDPEEDPCKPTGDFPLHSTKALKAKAKAEASARAAAALANGEEPCDEDMEAADAEAVYRAVKATQQGATAKEFDPAAAGLQAQSENKDPLAAIMRSALMKEASKSVEEKQGRPEKNPEDLEETGETPGQHLADAMASAEKAVATARSNMGLGPPPTTTTTTTGTNEPPPPKSKDPPKVRPKPNPKADELVRRAKAQQKLAKDSVDRMNDKVGSGSPETLAKAQAGAAKSAREAVDKIKDASKAIKDAGDAYDMAQGAQEMAANVKYGNELAATKKNIEDMKDKGAETQKRIKEKEAADDAEEDAQAREKDKADKMEQDKKRLADEQAAIQKEIEDNEKDAKDFAAKVANDKAADKEKRDNTLATKAKRDSEAAERAKAVAAVKEADGKEMDAEMHEAMDEAGKRAQAAAEAQLRAEDLAAASHSAEQLVRDQVRGQAAAGEKAAAMGKAGEQAAANFKTKIVQKMATELDTDADKLAIGQQVVKDQEAVEAELRAGEVAAEHRADVARSGGKTPMAEGLKSQAQAMAGKRQDEMNGEAAGQSSGKSSSNSSGQAGEEANEHGSDHYPEDKDGCIGWSDPEGRGASCGAWGPDSLDMTWCYVNPDHKPERWTHQSKHAGKFYAFCDTDDLQKTKVAAVVGKVGKKG
eukprot:TRINITY_DN33980_c2_g1_i1.p1 TRINITY_DN33980_c2_g1~~TRINITY_DN33980_c2_g1_i1.p1  ORF type:complete len:778 (-),score=316.86 TRINITY_DN33980_c2_g1_i1:277-2610(-)